MAYKETAVTGSTFHRFSKIVVGNDFGQVPAIVAIEQKVVQMPDADPIVQEVGNVSFQFDAAVSFPVLNPETNEPTGKSMTGAQVQVAIYSYIMFEATKRDALAVQRAKEAEEQMARNAAIAADARRIEAEAAAQEAKNQKAPTA